MSVFDEYIRRISFSGEQEYKYHMQYVDIFHEDFFEAFYASKSDGKIVQMALVNAADEADAKKYVQEHSLQPENTELLIQPLVVKDSLDRLFFGQYNFTGFTQPANSSSGFKGIPNEIAEMLLCEGRKQQGSFKLKPLAPAP